MILSKPQEIKSKLSLDAIYVLKELNNLKLNNLEFNNKDNIINNIIHSYNNSLFSHQYNNNNMKNQPLLNNYNDFKIKIDNMINNNIINHEIIDIYDKIDEINIKLKPKEINKSNIIIKSDNKIIKKLLNEKTVLTKKLYNNNNSDNINSYINYKNKLNNIIQDLENIKCNDIILIKQIHILSSFLMKYDYIDTDYILKIKGKLILQINECNSFLLIEILQHNKFNDLPFSEIVALCSILINENKSNNIYISDLDCSPICSDILYFIENIQTKYLKEETYINNLIPYPYNLDWNLNYSMFNSIKLWAENNDWNYIYNQENNLGNFFQGNFIKTILRITNILKNIENISNIFDNINIINKLKNFEEKLIRDIVITDSLYII